MWVASSVQVGDQAVGLNVERLDKEEREHAAATLALLTLEAMTSGEEAQAVWHEQVEKILRQHVTFEIEGEPGRLNAMWWFEALGYALIQFVRQNDLAPSINRHIDVMQRVDRGSPRES
jgi:hypothetical protein